MTLGYKVVTRRNSRAFEPCTTAALQRIRYRIGKKTERQPDEFGPFAVFESEQAAMKFLEKHGDAVLEVEFTESNDKSLWKKLAPSFERNRNSPRGYSPVANGKTEKFEGFPSGTLFADEVTPLRRVDHLRETSGDDMIQSE